MQLFNSSTDVYCTGLFCLHQILITDVMIHTILLLPLAEHENTNSHITS